ncbi:MAG: response regulator transcription factor [Chloroflexi bacterium]|nr:response regulator transcription factor [Chloroflexota bacterium]
MKILVVDDDPDIAEIIAFALGKDHHSASIVHTGASALALMERERFDLMILDVMMPRVDGYEVCQRVRRQDAAMPIIMLTAKDSEADKVRGLDLGADDYVTKPFSPRELLARVRALGRRAAQPVAGGAEPVIAGGRLAINLDAYEVLKEGQPVQLTPLEFELIRCLTLNIGRVVPHDKLLSFAWGPNYGSETELLKVHIRHLREKLERDPSTPEHIVTVRGIGYKLNK